MAEQKKQTRHYGWAVGPHLAAARPVSQVEQRDAKNTVAWVATDKLVDLMDPSQKESVHPGQIAEVMTFWNQGGLMEPPVIATYDDRLIYADGRARVLAAQAAGVRHVPVVLPKDELDTLHTLIGPPSPRPPLLSGR